MAGTVFPAGYPAWSKADQVWLVNFLWYDIIFYGWVNFKERFEGNNNGKM